MSTFKTKRRIQDIHGCWWVCRENLIFYNFVYFQNEEYNLGRGGVVSFNFPQKKKSRNLNKTTPFWATLSMMEMCQWIIFANSFQRLPRQRAAMRFISSRLLFSLLVAASVSISRKQHRLLTFEPVGQGGTCRTPHHQPGSCLPLAQCQHVRKLLSNTISALTLSYLKRSVCRFSGDWWPPHPRYILI